MSHTSATPAAGQGRAVPNGAVGSPRRRSRFWFVYAMILFGLLLAGFSRTFFVRGLFFDEPLPPILVAHGVLGTAWFLLLLVQTGLMASGRRRLHFRVGAAGTVAILAVAVVGLVTVVGVYPRSLAHALATGEPADPDVLSSPERYAQVARDSLGFVAFVGLAAAALALRRRPAVHKRLMMLASLMLLSAAIGRIFQWPALAVIPPAAGFFATLVVLLALPAVRDRVAEGRIHPTWKWGAPALFLYIVASSMIPLLV